MTKTKTRPSNPPQVNLLAAAFREAVKPTSCLFTMGCDFAADHITAKLPRHVGASLIASGIATTDRQFNDLVSVLQMLVTADAESLTPTPAKPLPSHLSRWR